MAKQIRDNFQIQQAMQKSLQDAGIENRAALDKMMSTTTIEKILSDAPAVYNYFKLANLGLDSLINPKDLREVAFAMPTPEYYREYFDNQNPQAVPYLNCIPYQDIFDYQALGQKAGFKPEQIEGYAMILNASGNTQPEAAWADVEGQGAPPAGGAGKNMGTGAPAYGGGTPAYGGTPTYGGGTGKAMSTGGTPQSKNLAPPGAPPGMGGPTGGYPPPGGGGGGLPPNWDPTAGTQWTRDYVDQHLANDPNYQGFQAVFARSDMTNGMIAGLMQEEAMENSVKQKIMNELSTLDARTPEGARRISMLNYQMQEINNSRSLRMDKMMTVKRHYSEFISIFKDMMDIKNRGIDTISRNLRQ